MSKEVLSSDVVEQKRKKREQKAPIKAKTRSKYIVDLTHVTLDAILDATDLEKFLRDRIKVEKKTGNLGTNVSISCEKRKIVVAAEIPFSKRYLKYLTRKYLKKQQLRDYLRIIAISPNAYGVYFYDPEAVLDETS
ncbi:ribosomal protein RPL22 [Cardiosporidium cionae]|uniref:Large ribosomal subunit protein eL22 n=1 Tax=Cardiosporidium cionae TaxID=476202 RepID=A0ABQ7J7L3_9APIC|nr:ribosomal protein RPL22 [Cardiosporidium cionae]|eukprot:KAF8819961.1 ribosomal protein RPL22 [Cardiosporidium cionae]